MPEDSDSYVSCAYDNIWFMGIPGDVYALALNTVLSIGCTEPLVANHWKALFEAVFDVKTSDEYTLVIGSIMPTDLYVAFVTYYSSQIDTNNPEEVWLALQHQLLFMLSVFTSLLRDGMVLQLEDRGNDLNQLDIIYTNCHRRINPDED